MLDIVSFFYFFHHILRIEDGLCMPLHEIVVDVGVCGGYDYEVGGNSSAGKGGFAFVQLPPLFVLGM